MSFLHKYVLTLLVSRMSIFVVSVWQVQEQAFLFKSLTHQEVVIHAVGWH